MAVALPKGKQNWLPWCAFTSTQHKGVIFHWPIAMWFPVSLLEDFAPQCCWQGCFCENFLFYCCQGYSNGSSHLNDSFLLTPLVLATVSLGVCSNRYMMRGRWGPSLSSLPYLYTHQQFSSSLFPRFSVFCHTSASSLNPHLNSTVTCPGFLCSSF